MRPLHVGSVLALMAALGAAAATRAFRAPPVLSDLGAVYLVPDQFLAKEPGRINLALRSRDTQGGEQPAEWRSIAPDWFFARAAGTQENRQADFFPDAALPLAFPLEHPGVTMFGIESRPHVQTVAPGAFRTLAIATLSEHEAEEVIGAMPRGRDVRVRRVDAAKALISVQGGPGAGPDAATAVTESGQSVEIFLMADPTAIKVGSDIPVIVSSGTGDEAAGIRVFAATLDGAIKQEAVTNESGIAFIRIGAPGVWRLEFRHAEPIHNDPAADIALFTGTATFSVPPLPR